MTLLWTMLACGPKTLATDPVLGLAPVEVLERLGQQDDVLWVERTGGSPRAVRRYNLEVGSEASLVLAMDMDMTVDIDGLVVPMVLPRMEIGLDSVVTGSNAMGFEVTADVTRCDAVGRPGADEAVVAALADTLGEMVGLRTVSTFSPTGTALGAHTSVPADASAELRGHVDSVNDSLSQLGLILPDQAIGAGAVWTRATRVGEDSFPLVMVTRSELISASRDVLEVRTEVSQFRVDPDAAPQAGTQVLRFEAGGQGATTQSMREAVPRTSHFAVSMALDLSADGQRMSNDTTMISTLTRLP